MTAKNTQNKIVKKILNKTKILGSQFAVSMSKKGFLQKTKGIFKETLASDNIKNYIKKQSKLSKEIISSISIQRTFQNLQDLIEQKIEGEKIEVALKTSTMWAKIITWSLAGGTVFGIGWLAIAKTEEIVVAIGKLEPIEGVIEIKMPVSGVTNEILIKEGETVKKGQILLRLDTESTVAEAIALEKSLNINLEILNSLKVLSQEGAIAKIQYLQQENQVADIRSEITKNNMTMKYQKIVSPVDGLIFDLKPKKAGFVVNPNEPILKIVPDGKLRANIEIESRNIGFVSVGKPADISIDSFPASDFGVIEGVVESLSSDALPPDPRMSKGYRFPAKIALKTQYLKLKNEKTLPLQVGMSLTANIKLRKVSYLQLLLNTFQEKSDALRSI